MKRLFDFCLSLLGLLCASPVLLVVMFLVWREDGHSPFYIAPRVGRGGQPFRMVKMRSMRIGADRSGVSSTSNTDNRITPVGHFIRRFKIDELTQLWNVLRGDMSFVGPRPQVQSGVDLYTPTERGLLSVRPGITDFASIVFSDEGTILSGSADPDADYDRLIRPWKSRLGLLYVQSRSLMLDIQLIFLTALAIVSRQRALDGVVGVLQGMGVDPGLVDVCRRQGPLAAGSPPGADFRPFAASK